MGAADIPDWLHVQLPLPLQNYIFCICLSFLKKYEFNIQGIVSFLPESIIIKRDSHGPSVLDS